MEITLHDVKLTFEIQFTISLPSPPLSLSSNILYLYFSIKKKKEEKFVVISISLQVTFSMIKSLDVKTILMENKPRVIKIVCTVHRVSYRHGWNDNGVYGSNGSKIARDRNHIILLLN